MAKWFKSIFSEWDAVENVYRELESMWKRWGISKKRVLWMWAINEYLEENPDERSSIQKEMDEFIEYARWKWYDIDEVTWEILDPDEEIEREFSDRFTTYYK
jgi:hypothetical protein